MLSPVPLGFQQRLCAGRWNMGSSWRLCWKRASCDWGRCALARWGHLEMIGPVTWDRGRAGEYIGAWTQLRVTLRWPYFDFWREGWPSCWCPKHDDDDLPDVHSTHVRWWPKKTQKLLCEILPSEIDCLVDMVVIHHITVSFLTCCSVFIVWLPVLSSDYSLRSSWKQFP